jgi:hypothetical protein
MSALTEAGYWWVAAMPNGRWCVSTSTQLEDREAQRQFQQAPPRLTQKGQALHSGG